MDRLKICEACGIYSTSQKICNGSLYINPETNDVSIRPKNGYIKGCGCYIPRKIIKLNSKCPAGKW
jgi:hypothetical protein